jgi:hypothetical protein
VHKTILFSFLNLISICVLAQNEAENDREIILLYMPVKETYLITGVGLNQFTQLETMVSPLVYKGIGAGASIGLQRRKKERITLLNTHWTKANLYNTFQPKQYLSALTHVNLSASTCYLINKIQFKNIKTRLGWQLSHQSDYRRNTITPDGNNFENGIPPDVAIWMQDNSVNNGIDEIIERGIKYVKDGN